MIVDETRLQVSAATHELELARQRIGQLEAQIAARAARLPVAVLARATAYYSIVLAVSAVALTAAAAIAHRLLLWGFPR